MTLYPMLMAPFYQPRPWGGRRMKDLLGKDIPPGPVGESWEVSPHANGLSHVGNGPLEGMSLVELTQRFGAELLGDRVFERYAGSFPLLIKLLDARQNLSLQVHPSPEYAAGRPEVNLKTEGWYVVDADSKKRARLSCIRHLLGLIPYEDVLPDKVDLPPLQVDEGYHRPPISSYKIIP